ncbi:MAG: aminotransferase class [Gemmatimonadetes bacterium]|nr:aminotransferase class [Gemmatimonadota bacterium]
MPTTVLDAIAEHLELEATTGGYEAADAKSTEIEHGYEHLAELVGARARNMAVVANATAGFVQAVSSFDFAPGDVIVTTRCDYTSNQIQYLALHERLGVEVVHAEDLPEGGVDPDSVRHAVASSGPRCKLVAVSWIPTNSGLVQDVESVGQVCEDLGVPYLVDACQAVGQIPIDVAKLRCDYLSATARKFLRGPRGIGFMFASDRALARGDHPLFVDMRGARWISTGRYEVDPTARRYEGWELPYALVLGQSAAAEYALGVGIDVAHERAWTLAARLRTGLAAIPRVRVLDRGARQCAIVTTAIDGMDARTLVTHLAGKGINTVPSLREYGQYDFAAKNVESAIRYSPHYYNTEAEVDAAIAETAYFLGN